MVVLLVFRKRLSEGMNDVETWRYKSLFKRFSTDVGFCLFQFSIKVESTFTLCAINFEALEIYYYDSLFMNFSNYVYDACQEIWEIVAGVHSMLIARSDQEIARQNDGVSCGEFLCYYITRILNNNSCIFPPNFTIHDFRCFTSRSEKYVKRFKFILIYRWFSNEYSTKKR